MCSVATHAKIYFLPDLCRISNRLFQDTNENTDAVASKQHGPAVDYRGSDVMTLEELFTPTIRPNKQVRRKKGQIRHIVVGILWGSTKKQ